MSSKAQYTIGKHFRIYTDNLLGEGSFGKVYLGKDLYTNQLKAVKTESKKNNIHLLQTESNVINYVNQQINDNPVIRNYWYGSDSKNNYLVTDLLGSTVESLLKKSGGKFQLKTVLMLAEQMIDRIKYYHNRNIIHRDIKPDNFLLELDKPQQNIYLIDFGLAKKYRKNSTKKHIPYSEDKPHIGTARYMSVNAHEKKEQSRRDDMYSIGYVILYMLLGKLPWQGINERTKKERYKKIHKIKKLTTNEELVKNFRCRDCRNCYAQVCMKKYFDYLDTCAFDSEINYNFLINEILICMEKHDYAYDYKWDWESDDSE